MFNLRGYAIGKDYGYGQWTKTLDPCIGKYGMGDCKPIFPTIDIVIPQETIKILQETTLESVPTLLAVESIETISTALAVESIETIPTALPVEFMTQTINELETQPSFMTTSQPSFMTTPSIWNSSPTIDYSSYYIQPTPTKSKKNKKRRRKNNN